MNRIEILNLETSTNSFSTPITSHPTPDSPNLDLTVPDISGSFVSPAFDHSQKSFISQESPIFLKEEIDHPLQM